MSKTFEGNLNANGLRVAIVSSRFNEFVVDALVKGAKDCLVRLGANEKDIDYVRVPGAFELPLAVKKVAANDSYDAVVVLGAVIRGATPHFDFVANEATKGIGAITLNSEKPITNGVLTVDTIEQAIERSGTKAGNKGAEAAMCAVEMVNLLRDL